MFISVSAKYDLSLCLQVMHLLTMVISMDYCCEEMFECSNICHHVRMIPLTGHFSYSKAHYSVAMHTVQYSSVAMHTVQYSSVAMHTVQCSSVAMHTVQYSSVAMHTVQSAAHNCV